MPMYVLYAFDLLALDGDDLRSLPLSMRKTNLARLLARRPEGIFVAPFEQGEIGPDLFRAACKMGTRGHGVEASRSRLPRRPMQSLGQGQEPRSSRDESREAVVFSALERAVQGGMGEGSARIRPALFA
jgi:hypothetical protein